MNAPHSASVFVPQGPAVDAHAHVFGGPEYPFDPGTNYVPEPSQRGTIAGFRSTLATHGLTHGLLVAAQPYGYDNRAMLDAIAASDGRMRGVALVPASITDRELDALHAGGVVGIRWNLTTYGLREFTEPGADRLLARLNERGWFLQVHCEHDELVPAAPIIRKSGVVLVVDHFGRPNLARGLGQPGFRTLLELGCEGTAICKLSGPFRCSLAGPPYADVDPYIEAAVAAFGHDRIVYGSDWPFVKVGERVDYGPQLACVARWFPDPAMQRRLLWDNPARLFGFA